ncbi:hypothetical protein ABZ835_32845 [Streptomyces sp. NPDC047461]|uniref:zinc ribbon domain-containing protein n=1 Tax=Streptomyces sp. NPDC047461 TaxID=3155619 RepID=UPI0033E6B298
MASLRADALHKLTTAVAAEYGTVVVEDLNVAGFGEIRRQLTYKTRQRHATRTIAADRWYPSSKTCSGCAAVKAKLPLHVRTSTSATPALWSSTGTPTSHSTSPRSRQPQQLVPEWPETRTPKRRRSLVEPTTRRAPPAPAARRRRGGQVARTCRTSCRRKRETVLKPKPSRSGDETDFRAETSGMPRPHYGLGNGDHVDEESGRCGCRALAFRQIPQPGKPCGLSAPLSRTAASSPPLPGCAVMGISLPIMFRPG